MQVGTRVRTLVEIHGGTVDVPVNTIGMITSSSVIVKFKVNHVIVNCNVGLEEIVAVEVTPVSYYATTLTTQMVMNGNYKPNLVRCDSALQTLEFAKEQVAMGEDVNESTFGCITVFSDGSIDQQLYTVNDLDF